MHLMGIPAYLKKIILSLLLLIAAFNFIKTTFKVLDRSKRLDNLKTEVSQLEEDRFDLNNELEYKESKEFVVEEARNKLGLVKPEEELFVVSRVLGDKSYSDSPKRNINNQSNIMLWFNLFF